MATVMIIDDDPVLLSSLNRLLSGYDVHVEAFPSAEDATRWLDGGGVPDVVICDHRLPGLRGFDFLAALAERHPKAALFLHTADDSEAAGFNSAEFAVLVKPVPPQHLRQIVNRALGRKMPPPW